MESFRIVIDAMDNLDQKGGFELLNVPFDGVLGNARVFGQLLQ